MPLSRYRQIRNEYSLADPQMYKVANKDDPEALLEGVSMAGVVGLLRQLGDLAEFAAEIFHDLHEEVTATAARGHTLIIRVQQLESVVPLVERTLLTQTSHTSFLYNSGVDCHPNLQMEENLVTRRDLPRLVMDSCEECRGPPRLFLLDKFDVAGAGACLKRYTDPSFFKRESVSNRRNSEGQSEKKSQRLKNRAPRWRNGDPPESFPSSHAKLHQLFLEENLENDVSDTECRVKLKRRQFTKSFLDQDNKKTYVEKFVYTSLSKQKVAISNDGCDLAREIVEIGTVSPTKNDKSLFSSIDTTELEMKPSVDDFSEKKSTEITDSETVEVIGLDYGSDACKIVKLVRNEECGDQEANSELSFDDGFASEIDNYMDALPAIESEADTDSECKNTSNSKADFYEKEGKREPQILFSDSHSVDNSTTLADGSNFFKGRKNSSRSISVNSSAESATDPDDMSFNHDFMPLGIPRNEIEGHTTSDIDETANLSCPRKNSFLGREVHEENSNFHDLGIVDSQSAPERADSGQWPSGKQPFQDETGQNSVCPENLDNLPSTADDSVHFRVIESKKVDNGTQTIHTESDATTEHECSDKHHDQSKDFSHDAFPSDMPFEVVVTSNLAAEADSNSSLDHDISNMEHKATVIDTNCCKQVDAENDLQENVMRVSSSVNLKAKKLSGLNDTSQAIQKVTNTVHLVGPDLTVLDMNPGEPQMSLEPPPLPLLPPMQWRLGKFQNSLIKTEIVLRSPNTLAHRGYSNCNASNQGVLTLPVPLAVSDDNPSTASSQTSMGYQNGNQTSKESGSLVEACASNDCPVGVEENLNFEIGYENGKFESITELREQEGSLSSHDELSQSSKVQNDWDPQPSLVASATSSILPSTHNGDLPNADANANVNEMQQKKPARSRNPLMHEIVSVDQSKLRKVERVKPPVESEDEDEESLFEQFQLRKAGERASKARDESKTEEISSQSQLRKVGERARAEIEQQPEEAESPRLQLRKVAVRTHSPVEHKTENRDSLLEQIRNKSFNLKPAALGRPNVQGPTTNLKLAAILQKASNIRQAMAGSDEDDDADNWSE